MKTLITILLPIMLAVSFSTNAASQDHEIHVSKDAPVVGGLADYHVRGIMMDQIVEDPEMRQEMMNKMMQSMDVHQMMNNPAMKARMEKHVGMMQAMLNSAAMDPAMMNKMMGNPEMMSRMKMYMMCAQTTNDEMKGEHSMENGEEHTH